MKFNFVKSRRLHTAAKANLSFICQSCAKCGIYRNSKYRKGLHIIGAISQQWERLHIPVNSAGISFAKPLADNIRVNIVLPGGVMTLM
ncbi:MAG: hypothetical protein ACREOI_13110 [bacterium]